MRPPGDPAGRRSGERRPGLHRLRVEEGEGLLYVPTGYQPGRPTAAVVLLHGAGSDSHAGLAPLLGLADDTRLILLAPDARGRTWDLILGQHGGDFALIDLLLG